MATLAERRSGLQAGTLSALRYPDFRLYFIGQLIALSGVWMQGVAQGWLVFQLTRSELMLGIVACAAGLPSLLLSPLAGVIIDRTSRRRLLMLTKTGHLILAFALGLLVATNTVQVWHIVVLAFLLGVTNSLDAPARLTIIADLVGHKELSSGVALNSIMFHVSRIIGTTLAGIALVEVGAAWCFLLNGISSIAVIASLLMMHDGAVNLVTSTLSPLQRVKEGLRFSRRHGTIAPLLLLAVIASLFTNNIGALLPAFADEILHSPTQAYADINQMMGVGAIIGALLMPLLGNRFRRGRVVTAMTAFSGVVALLATQTVSISSAVILMALFSFGIVLQFATVNTLIQNEVPDEFRGRVMSLYTVTWFGLSPFGTLFLGAIAEGIGTPQAMALYTLAGTILSLIVVARSGKMRRLP